VIFLGKSQSFFWPLVYIGLQPNELLAHRMQVYKMGYVLSDIAGVQVENRIGSK
jgi:hypothetical protein